LRHHFERANGRSGSSNSQEQDDPSSTAAAAQLPSPEERRASWKALKELLSGIDERVRDKKRKRRRLRQLRRQQQQQQHQQAQQQTQAQRQMQQQQQQQQQKVVPATTATAGVAVSTPNETAHQQHELRNGTATAVATATNSSNGGRIQTRPPGATFSDVLAATYGAAGRGDNGGRTGTGAPAANERIDIGNVDQPPTLEVAIDCVKKSFPVQRSLNQLQPWEAVCMQYFRNLLNHRWISGENPKFVFHAPVPTLYPELRDSYLSQIQKPMDLTTVECRLLAGNHYKGPEEFVNEVALVFANAIQFNKQGHDTGHALSSAYYNVSKHLLRYSRWTSLGNLLSRYVDINSNHVDEAGPGNLPPFSWKLTEGNAKRAREEQEMIVRQAPIEKSRLEDKVITWQETVCVKLLTALRQQPGMLPFYQLNYPLGSSSFPSRPMDLETVEKNLKEGQFNTFGEFFVALDQVASNIRENYSLGTEPYEAAKKMSAIIEAYLLEVSNWIERERIDRGINGNNSSGNNPATSPLQRPSPLPLRAAASVAASTSSTTAAASRSLETTFQERREMLQAAAARTAESSTNLAGMRQLLVQQTQHQGSLLNPPLAMNAATNGGVASAGVSAATRGLVAAEDTAARVIAARQVHQGLSFPTPEETAARKQLTVLQQVHQSGTQQNRINNGGQSTLSQQVSSSNPQNPSIPPSVGGKQSRLISNGVASTAGSRHNSHPNLSQQTNGHVFGSEYPVIPTDRMWLARDSESRCNKCVVLLPDVGKPKFSGALHDRKTVDKVYFAQPSVADATRSEMIERLKRYEPFWQFVGPMRVENTSPVIQPRMKEARTALSIRCCVGKDLVFEGTDIFSLIPKENWGKELVADDMKTERYALMIRMLPLNKSDKMKRADGHLWPKGTFLMVNGKPTQILQRRQEGHDEKSWKGVGKHLDLTPLIHDPNQELSIDMGCYDEEQYLFCLSICKYRSVDSLFSVLTTRHNKEAITYMSRQESLKKIDGFVSSRGLVLLDDDDNNNDGQEQHLGKIVFPLKCEISKKLIKVPVRGKDCRHFQVCTRGFPA